MADKTKTVKYGADAKKPTATPTTESAKAFVERGVVERHGEAIRNNPNFDAMVKEESRQIEENRKATEGM